MIRVSDWSEAPDAIAELQADPGALEQRRLACETWWQEHKRATALRVQDAIHKHLVSV